MSAGALSPSLAGERDLERSLSDIFRFIFAIVIERVCVAGWYLSMVKSFGDGRISSA